MNKDNKFVQEFINELNCRINILSNSRITTNSDNSNYLDIINILNKYDVSSDTLQFEDMKKISYKDIQEIIQFIYPPHELDSYKILDDSKYEIILADLNRYLIEYKKNIENQNSIFNEKIITFHKYINLFNVVPNEPFENFDELKNIMTELGLSSVARWNILKVISNTNNKYFANPFCEVCISINNLTEQVLNLSTTSELDTIESLIADCDIDANSIFLVAKSISDNCGIHYDIVLDVLIMTYSSSLYYELMKDKNDETLDTIEWLLAQKKYLYPALFYKAYYVINDSFDKMYEINKLNIDPQIIIDSSIEDLMEIAHTRENAIDLKECLALNSLFETWFNIHEDDDELDKKMIVIKGLLDQVSLYENKKNNIKELT